MGVLVPIVFLGIGCRGPEPVSDTGFIGTWQRVDSTSTISFARTESGLVFDWILDADDRSVRCDGRGRCDERFRGDKVYEWTFRAEVDTDGKSLRLAREGTPIGATTTPLTEVDRVEIRPGGLELYAFTIERDGAPLGAPNGPFRYRKISDRPR